MNPPRRRRPYRRKEHWTETLWFWVGIMMCVGWFAVYQGVTFAQKLGLLP